MYTRRRFGLELEARLDEDYDADETARWALALLDDPHLDPDVVHQIARAAVISEQSQAGRGMHALRALARSLSGKGVDYKAGAIKERELFEILACLLDGPEAFAPLLRRLHRGIVGERDAADLAARLEKLAALGWVDVGLARGGDYRALGKVSRHRLLADGAGYHFSLSRAGADAWADFSVRGQDDPTPPARRR